MYIIACIKDRVVYSKEDFITPSIEIAKAKLKAMKENGDKYSKVYEIIDLKEVED